MLNLDQKIDRRRILAFWFEKNTGFFGLFESYPQFSIFVHAIVDKAT